MNLDQWLDCIAEAYKKSGKSFSSPIKEILLKKLPETDQNVDIIDRDAMRTGVIWIPFKVEDESQNAVIEDTKELMIQHFFDKFICSETFGPIIKVNNYFGQTVEDNYELVDSPFIDMAKTYWTFKFELKELFPKYHNLILPQILLRVENFIGSIFFPFPGPIILWVRGRREKQKQLLEQYAPEIDIDSFLDNNPLLGTLDGRISKEVFNERIWISCPNSNCLHFLKVPNSIKLLKVTCTNCKTSFRFPARDISWLNQLRPDVHPEKRKVDELERLRQLYNIPHELFTLGVLSSRWATGRIQKSVYSQFREKNPKATEKETLKAVFKSRAHIPVPSSYEMSEEEIDKALESINSIEELINYIITKEEAEEPATPDPLGIGARIDSILSG